MSGIRLLSGVFGGQDHHQPAAPRLEVNRGVDVHPSRLRYLRRWYFAGVGAGFAVLLLVRFFVIGATDGDRSTAVQIAGQIVDSLIGATIAAAVIATLVAWLLPASDDTPVVTALDAREIQPILRAQAALTREWLVRARTASYFRAATIAWLAEQSVARNTTIKVSVQLMDPADAALHRAYSRYLGTLGSGGVSWDARRVRREVYASLVGILSWREEFPRLDPEVRVVGGFWVLSLDITQSAALVTGQYRGHPGMLYGEGSPFYDSYRDEFYATWFQAREIDMTVRCPVRSALTVDDIRSTLAALNVGAGDLNADDHRAILAAVRSPEHRFR